MKIKIDADGYHFTLPLPIAIISNSIAIRILVGYIKRYTGVQLTAEHLEAFFYELKCSKKLFNNLLIVDVSTNDGTKVSITL